MESETRKALLVNDQDSNTSLLVNQLKKLGFSCFFAYSFEEAKTKLLGEDFDVVLSRLSIDGGTAYELRPLLVGRPTSLFYSLSVQQGCWWIPGVRHGAECMGEPAIRPDDFFKSLAPSTANSSAA